MSERLQIAEPAGAQTSPQWQAFLELGFRPLYLAGCVWAAFSMALWIGAPQLLAAALPGVLCHAHEMLWAFIATIAVGFLLSAASNWTGSNPLSGTPLGLLLALWSMARIGYLLPGAPAFWAAAGTELAFFVWAAVALAGPSMAHAAGATMACRSSSSDSAWPMRCTSWRSRQATAHWRCSASTPACCAWP